MTSAVFAMDYRDEDIAHLKEERRYFSTREQGADKTERRFCQRRIKAITFALNHMEGKGPTLVPNELELDIITAITFATSEPRVHYPR